MHVVKFLQDGGTLADLESRYAIVSKRHGVWPSIVLLKYSQIDSPMAEPIVQECRGLLLDESMNWSVFSRPYDKFFNHGEGHAAKIDWSTARVYEKLDGSLCTLWWNTYDGKWHVSTSGSPDASGPVHDRDGITFKDLFWQVWAELGYRLPSQLSLGCYMFELMTPLNRIIVPHQKNRLVLHGARAMDGHVEWEPEPIAESQGWECVKSYPITSMADAIKACEALNPMESEGYVVRDAQFNRVKVKSPQYVALSHMKDGFSDRRMLELVRSNESSEFLNYFPEYRGLYEGISSKYTALSNSLEEHYEAIKHIEVQKDFAMAAQKCRCPGALFSVRNGKHPTIKAHLSDMSLQSLERLI